MAKQDRAKIIFLNGASNSGKTTIAKELQAILVEPYLHIGIDTFINMLPTRYVGAKESAKAGFYWRKTINEAGVESGKICAGNYGKRVISGMGYACLALLSKGLNIIMDEVCYGKSQIDFYRNLFKDYPATYVGIYCPLDVIVKRERENNAKISTAAQELAVVHEGVTYDIEVDTSIMTPLECAEEIEKFLRNVRNVEYA